MPLTAIVLCFGFTGLDGNRDTATQELGNGAPVVMATEYGDIGPVSDLLGDLIDIIGEMMDALEDPEGTSSSEGGSTQIDTALLAARLNSAEADIDWIIDEFLYPSLVPADAGDIDPTVNPSTLAEHASACVDLAHEAYGELLIGPKDHELVGTKLKTIKALLPEYRALAGIE